MAQQLPTSKGVNFYSIAKEIEIGRVQANRMAQSTTVLHSPYLTGLGQELAAHANEIQFPYSFAAFRGAPPSRLLALPLSLEEQGFNEAIAIAGGPVFVPAQLVEKLENEPELAAVLAHAITHIALRHPTRMATMLELVNQASEGLPHDLPSTPAFGFRSFARRFESAADTLAIHILVESGYDPTGFIRYLEKCPDARSIFAAQPSRPQRIQAVKAAIGSLAAKTHRADSVEFAEWKSAVIR